MPEAVEPIGRMLDKRLMPRSSGASASEAHDDT
jgi:hypothetical protein